MRALQRLGWPQGSLLVPSCQCSAVLAGTALRLLLAGKALLVLGVDTVLRLLREGMGAAGPGVWHRRDPFCCAAAQLAAISTRVLDLGGSDNIGEASVRPPGGASRLQELQDRNAVVVMLVW